MRAEILMCLLSFGASIAAAQARGGVIDLSCDQLIGEPERDSARTERRIGDVWADSLGRARGTLVVVIAPYRPLEQLSAPFRVRVFRSEGNRSFEGAWAASPLVVTDSAGRARLEISFPGSTRRAIWTEFPTGRTDTLTVFLTRDRNTCEIDAAKQREAGRRVRPPNGGW